MIIPHEDTFWNDRDDVTIVSGDPLYDTKVDFMRTHGVVVFRIHDHMHAQRPDFTYAGAARALGLESRHETAPQSHRFTVPETTLGALAAAFQKRVGARALRVVGDPEARVSRIQLGVGYATPAVNSPEIDVVVSGEQQEADGAFDSPSTCSTPSRSAFPRAGSCSATPFRKSRACSRWLWRGDETLTNPALAGSDNGDSVTCGPVHSDYRPSDIRPSARSITRRKKLRAIAIDDLSIPKTGFFSKP